MKIFKNIEISDRRDKILHQVNTNGRGLEIGPSHRPMLRKADGYNIEVLDHCTKAELIRKYQNENVDITLIEEVDHIWPGGSLADIIAEKNCYDYVIASHVIEHTTDFIGFLKDIETLLKPNAVLSLAVPDKRFCFDCYRPWTGLARVIDAYFYKTQFHSPGTAAEHFLSYVSNDGKPGWGESSPKKFRLNHTVEEAKHFMKKSVDAKKYLDFHAWCFTPHSFLYLIECLADLGLINLRVNTMFPTVDSEFFVILSQEGPFIQKDRLSMLEEIKKEERDEAISSRVLLSKLKIRLKLRLKAKLIRMFKIKRKHTC
ncbi:class I SAM-dependent methyltransferase [bacterium]|nr:class I SAM-dependent methyltransferase [bacterium]